MMNTIKMLNDELRNMSVWFKVNKLSLNVSKQIIWYLQINGNIH